jgi:hypothetical protein
MKMKQKFSIILICAIAFTAIGTELKAQSNWEVGMRFGDKISIDGTIPIGLAPRFHPAIYITDRFGIGGYFDWMFALSDGPSGLKFYPGVGPEFFFEHDFDFHIAGDFGVEYSFDFPLTIGFDWRPGFKVTEKFKGKASNWGFTARFRIGKGKFVKAN